MVIGPSRKGFLGSLLQRPVLEREWGTAAAVAVAVLNGANVIRVHAVAEMRQVVRVAQSIRAAGQRLVVSMKGPVKGADMKRAKGPLIPKLFGTDGVRGVANVEPITSEVVLKLGRAAAYVFKTRPGRHRIVIGKDTRLSGYMIESALTAGICSMGVDVLLVGPLPTPAVAFLARSLRADAGVMISASHNPYEDNGIKFFSREGLKLPDEFERQIEDLVISHRIDSLRPTASEIGKAFRIDDAEGRYIEFVKQSLPKRFDLEGMPVVVDCAHGAAYKVAPHIYRELGARVTVIGDHPDGTNINRDCGAVHPRLLQETVKSEGAALGIAHDGDADRAVFVAEDGRVVDGDQILGALALDLKERDRLARRTLVTTTMSNVGLEQSMARSGIKLVRTCRGRPLHLGEHAERRL